MIKRIMSIVLIGIIALASLVGCSSLATEAPLEAGSSQDSAQETAAGVDASDGFPIKVTHSYGEANIESVPKKVVVFDMGILDMLDALGIEAELAVTTASLPSYLSKYEAVVNAGGIKEPDFETIMSFEPELIVISGRQADYYDEFNKIAPTWFVELKPESYMEDFKENLTNIGKIFGVSEKTDSLLAEIDGLVSDAVNKISKSDDRALIVLTNDGNISAYGTGSRFGLIHDMLGAKAADEKIEASTHGQSVSFEYIAETNPDILFVIDRTAVVGGEKKASDVLENELIRRTNAYLNDKIIYLDPEAWYLAGGGINSMKVMISEVAAAY